MIGPSFPVCIHTENQNQFSVYPFVIHEIYVIIEITLVNLYYYLKYGTPQKTPQLIVAPTFLIIHGEIILEPFTFDSGRMALHNISKATLGVKVVHGRQIYSVFYTYQVISQHRTRFKIKGVFFSH